MILKKESYLFSPCVSGCLWSSQGILSSSVNCCDCQRC